MPFAKNSSKILRHTWKATNNKQAKGIQARLCVRLQDNMAEANPPPHVPMEEEEDETMQIPSSTTRWKDVDVAAIHTSGANRTNQEFHTETDYRPAGASPQNQQAKYSDSEYYQIGRLRNTSTPYHLRGRDHKSVSVFYNLFVDHCCTFRVPLKILDDVNISKLDDDSESLIPDAYMRMDAHLRDSYGAAIYARLEEENVLDPADPLYTGLLSMYNSRRDGYALLKEILATTLMVQSHDIGPQSTSPTVQRGSTPYNYYCRLNEFYRIQQQRDRQYSVQEQAAMFLQGMAQEPHCTSATHQLLHDLQQIPEELPLPKRFRFPALPMTLLAHPASQRPSTATINVTRASRPPSSDDASTSFSSRRGYQDCDRSRERRPSLERGSRPPSDGGRSQRSLTSTTASTSTRNVEVQCKACATNGHTTRECRMFPKVAACMEYAMHNPAEAASQTKQYRQSQHPEALKAKRANIIKVLQGRYGNIDQDDDFDDVLHQLTGEYTTSDHDDHSASINRVQITSPVPIDNPSPYPTTEDLKSMIHPEKFPDIQTMQLWSTNDHSPAARTKRVETEAAHMSVT